MAVKVGSTADALHRSIGRVREQAIELRDLRAKVAAMEELLAVQRAECRADQRRAGVPLCGCGRDYLTLTVEEECSHPRSALTGSSVIGWCIPARASRCRRRATST